MIRRNKMNRLVYTCSFDTDRCAMVNSKRVPYLIFCKNSFLLREFVVLKGGVTLDITEFMLP